MARKRLIKGANAARVEERIARVPADMSLAESPAESSIFGALRALEGAATAPPQAPGPGAAPRAAKPKAPKAKAAPRQKAASPRKLPLPHVTEPRQEDAPGLKPVLPPKASRLSPSDFSAAEREAIVRCCSDYRNRLPTYLLAVQKEVKVLDSVIDKCQAAKGHPRKG